MSAVICTTVIRIPIPKFVVPFTRNSRAIPTSASHALCDHSRVVVDAQALTSTMAISNFTFDDAACTMYYNTTSYAIYSTGESALPTKFLKLVRKLLWIALECITLVMSTSRFCEAHAVHWSTPISYSESTSVTPIQFGRSSSACYGSLGAEHQLTATISSPICSNFQC